MARHLRFLHSSGEFLPQSAMASCSVPCFFEIERLYCRMTSRRAVTLAWLYLDTVHKLLMLVFCLTNGALVSKYEHKLIALGSHTALIQSI